MKKALSLLLVCIFIFSLSSCAKGPELDEVKARCEELILKSQDLQVIINGEGFSVYDQYYTGTDYWYVDLDESAYDTIEQISAEIDAVYAKTYAEGVKEVLFVGYSYEIGSLLPKYVEDEEGQLMQYKYLDQELPERYVFDFSAMTMVKSKAKSFTVSVPASCDGITENKEITFTYDKTGSVWLLNTPIY